MKGLYAYITICLVAVLLSETALYFKIIVSLLYLFGIYKYFYLKDRK